MSENLSNTDPSSTIPQQYKAVGEAGVDWVSSTFLITVHLVAFAFAFQTFSWAALGVCILLHWVTGGLGVTLGYHRLLTHRSFKVSKPIEYFLTICGMLSCEAGPITWVATHRAHHARSDTDADPHSPLKSFFWSHMGWCLSNNDELDTPEGRKRFAPDLVADPVHRFFDKAFILWTILLGLGLYALGGWSFVVWGIFVRLVLVYHCTWLVNSAAHVWGYRTYNSGDQSTNLWWVALLSYGEGWHNNHHAFQQSARHGLKWWEFDTTYLMIQILSLLGLASDIKIPTQHQLETKAKSAD